MGAWGAGPFENDAALDWAWDLEETGWKAVRDALSAVAVGGDIEVDEASCALAGRRGRRRLTRQPDDQPP